MYILYIHFSPSNHDTLILAGPAVIITFILFPSMIIITLLAVMLLFLLGDRRYTTGMLTLFLFQQFPFGPDPICIGVI